jgi:hypothetical protein
MMLETAPLANLRLSLSRVGSRKLLGMGQEEIEKGVNLFSYQRAIYAVAVAANQLHDIRDSARI